MDAELQELLRFGRVSPRVIPDSSSLVVAHWDGTGWELCCGWEVAASSNMGGGW